MKVIFLDIDGVLNTTQTFIDIYEEYHQTKKRRVEIDLERVKLLKEIVEKTSAVIVMSSSWRFYGKMIDGVLLPIHQKLEDLIQIFYFYGLSIYDITPSDKNGVRQKEIKEWLQNKKVESFIILDDDSYDLQDFVGQELIQTNVTNGLCPYHVEEAIKRLNLKK